MNLFSFWLFKMWLEKTSGICRHLNWDKKKARRQTMRIRAKRLAGSGNVKKKHWAGEVGFVLQTVQETTKMPMWTEQRESRKEAKDATRAPSARVSEDTMTWLLPWRRWELLWSSKWCDVNSFKSSSDCCWDQVVEGKGGIRDVAGGLYDACERCCDSGQGEGGGRWLDSSFLLEAQLAGFVGQQVVWTELLVTKMTPMILVWATTHTHTQI